MADQSAALAGQVTSTAAEIYDSQFVPALFGQFAPWLAKAAGVCPGHAVLDVGCGTGIAAIAAVELGASSVFGVDINRGMLDVARRKSPTVKWREAAAEELPFEADAFDRVLCQFALMFLKDQVKALAEMARVTRPGGRVAVAVWESVAYSPGYDVLVPLLGEIVGPEAEAALAAPFSIGNRNELDRLFAAAGLPPPNVQRIEGTAKHPSMEDWIRTEVGGWTLSEIVDEAQTLELIRASLERLRTYMQDDGSVSFPAPALFALADT